MTEPDEVEVLLIGGPRYGETVKLRAGTQSFADLVSGTTYLLRPFVWAPLNKITQQPDQDKAMVRFALAHESINDPQAAWALLDDHLHRLWMDEGGRPLREVVAEEAAAQAANGGTPDASATGIILNGKATP